MNTLSRRTIAKGAAWSVPVILVGAAAPMAAASGPVTVTFTGEGCKEPGKSQNYDWGYRCIIKIVATGTGVLTFTDVSAPGDPDAKVVAGKTHSFVAGNNFVTVTIGASNSANGTAILSYVADGVVGQVTVSIDGFHPCEK